MQRMEGRFDEMAGAAVVVRLVIIRVEARQDPQSMGKILMGVPLGMSDADSLQTWRVQGRKRVMSSAPENKPRSPCFGLAVADACPNSVISTRSAPPDYSVVLTHSKR